MFRSTSIIQDEFLWKKEFLLQPVSAEGWTFFSQEKISVHTFINNSLSYYILNDMRYLYYGRKIIAYLT